MIRHAVALRSGRPGSSTSWRLPLHTFPLLPIPQHLHSWKGLRYWCWRTSTTPRAQRTPALSAPRWAWAPWRATATRARSRGDPWSWKRAARMPRVYSRRSIGHWAPVLDERFGCPPSHIDSWMSPPAWPSGLPSVQLWERHAPCMQCYELCGLSGVQRPAGLRKVLEQLSAKLALSAMQHRFRMLREARTIQKTTRSPESGASVLTVAVLACRSRQPCVWQGSTRISDLAWRRGSVNAILFVLRSSLSNKRHNIS